jgi:hypothetical protein
VKNHTDVLIFHTAILCRRRHKIALMLHEKLHVQLSRELLDASVCGMEVLK